jgi:tetratricopeptide (TPR) repeat protein/DNA-binding XRE family transcriptional regulator
MDNLMQKNERLRRCRLQRSWRLSDVAEQLGTSVTTVQRWERGTQQPSLYYRGKLCELFDLPAQELGLADITAALAMDESQEPPARALEKPGEDHPLWTVPYARNPYFIGREDLFSRLAQLFPTSQAQVFHQVSLPPSLALTGLGGIGKTQMALEYAYRVHEQQPTAHILWITAASEETILTSFVTIAHLLPDMVGGYHTDQQRLVTAVRRWLEQCPSPWLLVVDDANDLPLLQSYLPLYGNGKILMTTRASAVGLLAVPLAVDDLLPEEGVRFLLRRTHRFIDASTEELSQVRQIVEALSYFPLALDQAGAYIEETGCHFATYLQLYQEHRQQLLARRGITSTHYPHSVATTWSLSFQYLKHQNPAAVLLLRLCAFLAPEHIPEELLTQGAAHWPPPLQKAVADPFAFNQMLQALLAFSLVKRLSSQQLVSLHRLVQTVQIEQMELDEQREWVVCVVHALHTLFPSTPTDPATWPLCQRYLEQAQACAVLIGHYHLRIPEAADLLDRTGSYFREMGFYRLGASLLQQALDLRELLLGTEHLATTESLNNLGLVYFRQGKYAQAQPLLERALHIREQHLGNQHLATAQSLNNLGLVYFYQGKYTQAQPLFQHALALAEELLGPDDEKTATCLENLGDLSREQGQYELSEHYFLRARMIVEERLAADHPLRVYVLTGLSRLFLIQEKDAEAEALIQCLLAIHERLWQTEHPQMSEPLYGLATLYARQGKHREAELLFQQALAIWGQQAHPDRARALAGLATLYSRQGKYGEAEPLLRQALAIDEHYLGKDHPETANALSNWADMYACQGQYQKAQALYQRALRIREHALGSDHTKTRETQQQVAAMRQVLNQE